MAKILDALKSGDTNGLPSSWPPSVEPVKSPPPVAPPEEVEEVPFIEVGGPNRQVEASPDVLGQSAAPKATRETPPPSPAPSEAAPTPAARATRTDAPVVAFRPWPPPVETTPATETDLIVLHQPDHPTSRQYFALLDQVLGADCDPQVLLFTALAAGQGVTTVLLNLALAAGASGERKVAVVDANWKNPGLAARLGLPAGPGLEEVISGSVALEHALRPAPAGHLHVLSGSSWSSRVFRQGGPEALRWVLRWLRTRFDLVFLDAPVWEESEEFTLLVALSDAVLPVVQESRLVQPRLHQMIQTMTQSGAHVRGVIHANLLAA
jgi:tyrosine-protein kinase Etk/Wzc